jgi:hypothetical protein
MSQKLPAELPILRKSAGLLTLGCLEFGMARLRGRSFKCLRHTHDHTA